MRIIAGSARGRRLRTLAGAHTRPTADRVKEAMFSVLAPYLEGARVLDAFAGSAALGLEALSRGAELAWFMESDRAAAEMCAKNIAQLGLPGCRLLRGDCLKLLPSLRTQGETMRFDLIFADPPYNRGLLPRLLDAVARGGWLAADGLLVAETTAAASEFAPDARWHIVKSSAYGGTAVHYCRLAEAENKGGNG